MSKRVLLGRPHLFLVGVKGIEVAVEDVGEANKQTGKKTNKQTNKETPAPHQSGGQRGSRREMSRRGKHLRPFRSHA